MKFLATLLAMFVLAGSSAFAAAGEGVYYQDWHDAKRNRTVPVRIMMPKTGNAPFPIVIFSHGLGGSRDGSTFLGDALTDAGYFVLFVQHPGSDNSVWQDKRSQGAQAIMQSMKAAANGEQLTARVRDIHFVIDELARRNESDPQLKGKLDLSCIAMTGHSFGAGTTAAIAGQSYGSAGAVFKDPRIKCAIYYSPPVSQGAANDPKAAFGDITVPGLIMTGTEDDSPIGNTPHENRRLAFDGMTAHDQYLVIFNGGDHMIFSGRMHRADKDVFFQPRITKLSVEFLNAYLRGDAKSQAWLKRDAATYLGNSGTWDQK